MIRWIMVDTLAHKEHGAKSIPQPVGEIHFCIGNAENFFLFFLS